MTKQNTLTFQVSMDPVELRNMAGVLDRIAIVVEGDADTTVITQHEHTAGNEDAITTATVDNVTAGALAPTNEGGVIAPEDYPIMINGVEVDKAGLPWNAEIHSGGKDRILKKTGYWKYKRGLDDATKAKVEGELKAAMGNTAAPIENNVVDINAGNGAAPAPAPVETLYTHSDGNHYTYDQLKASGWGDDMIHALPTVEQPVTEPVVEDVTFPALMGLITPALAADTITNEQILAVLNQVGTANNCQLTALPLLSARPDLVGQVKTALFG